MYQLSLICSAFLAVFLSGYQCLDGDSELILSAHSSWPIGVKLDKAEEEKNLDVESVRLADKVIESNDQDEANQIDSKQRESCKLMKIVHILKHPNCQSKAISSFACAGRCSSYVQLSTSKFWQHERSCSCCQQTRLQEATFTLDCPSLEPPYKKIKTYAPIECLCRACNDLRRETLPAQELIEALEYSSSPGSSSLAKN